MKIISHVVEKKFLVSLSETEFKQILGITTYNIKETLKVDDAILQETELEINNAFRTSENIKSIVKRQSFKDMKNGLLNAVRAIEEAETKFCNLEKTIDNSAKNKE